MCRILNGTQRKMTETRIGNTLSKFTAIHRPWPKLCGGICCYKTFCMRIFARRNFLRFRFCSIHVKIHVLSTYFFMSTVCKQLKAVKTKPIKFSLETGLRIVKQTFELRNEFKNIATNSKCYTEK